MAAGLGFKTFAVGEVLSAANVNGYLMQGVLVFASAAARDAAITSPQEGQFAFTKDNDSLWYYSGSAWVASGATGDIEGVTAGTGISGGGTSGTVTITNSMATAIDAKGDLIVGTGADTFSRLAVGTNTYVLTADSAEATGLKWVAPASGATFVGVRCSGDSTKQVISNTTTTAINWNVETFDTNGFHSTSSNTSRITIPSGKTGYYKVYAQLTFNNNAATANEVNLQIYKNGSRIVSVIDNFTGNTGINHYRNYSDTIYLTATDYLEVYTYQNTGSNLNVYFSDSGTEYSWFGLELIGV